MEIKVLSQWVFHGGNPNRAVAVSATCKFAYPEKRNNVARFAIALIASQSMIAPNANANRDLKIMASTYTQRRVRRFRKRHPVIYQTTKFVVFLAAFVVALMFIKEVYPR